jgi:endonuclease/exonuclease/phosphatase family metal-dependent hydrolase
VTDTPLIGPVAPPLIQIMTYNIRRRMTRVLPHSPDRWDRRRVLIERLLQAEQPVVLGVQEALPDQAGFVRHALGESYRSVGYGRNPNKRGEGCPLMYDTDRVELLAWRQTALSATPFEPGSTTWGNPTPRVVVAASFRERASGVEFRVLNTHFDQFSRRSRMHSADEILRLVAETSLPTVVTGDFNADDDSLVHAAIIRTGALVDTWNSAETRLTPLWGSFANYGPPQLERKRIDWILATPKVSVLRTGINVTRFDGKWPSDHAPVQAVVSFGSRSTPK